jgi:hypothetical protein
MTATRFGVRVLQPFKGVQGELSHLSPAGVAPSSASALGLFSYTQTLNQAVTVLSVAFHFVTHPTSH